MNEAHPTAEELRRRLNLQLQRPYQNATIAQIEQALRWAQWMFGAGMVLIMVGFAALVVAVAVPGWEWMFVLGVLALWGGIALVIGAPRILTRVRVR
jgi:hypothetical protein